VVVVLYLGVVSSHPPLHYENVSGFFAPCYTSWSALVCCEDEMGRVVCCARLDGVVLRLVILFY
jgi:hypothetical protein